MANELREAERLLGLTVEVIAAFVSNNSVQATGLSGFAESRIHDDWNETSPFFLASIFSVGSRDPQFCQVIMPLRVRALGG